MRKLPQCLGSVVAVVVVVVVVVVASGAAIALECSQCRAAPSPRNEHLQPAVPAEQSQPEEVSHSIYHTYISRTCICE